MRIHKAGYAVIATFFTIFIFVWVALYYFMGSSLALSLITIAIALFLLFVLRFFRNPHRKITFGNHDIVCPADGKVVVIENVEENEFIHQKMIQVSIFMSIWNVHINWYPAIGKVLNILHYNGRYLAAVLPKSSHENERSVIVMETQTGRKILIKQIAGAIARRIITYAQKNSVAKPGDQMGFIRFGSRVDVLLPADAEIKVSLNQKVRGGKTLMAII